MFVKQLGFFATAGPQLPSPYKLQGYGARWTSSLGQAFVCAAGFASRSQQVAWNGLLSGGCASHCLDLSNPWSRTQPAWRRQLRGKLLVNTAGVAGRQCTSDPSTALLACACQRAPFAFDGLPRSGTASSQSLHCRNLLTMLRITCLLNGSWSPSVLTFCLSASCGGRSLVPLRLTLPAQELAQFAFDLALERFNRGSGTRCGS